MKQNHKWTRLTALVLALTLVLTGCAASGGTLENSTQPVETPAAAPLETPVESVAPEDESGAMNLSGEDTPAEQDSEDSELLRRMGLVEDETVEISEEEGTQITRAAADMWRGYVAGPGGEDPLVESRDWSIYSSSLGQENLSKREAEFFKRLDKMCLKYLSTSGLDGVKYSYDGGKKVYYATDSVKYSDLGLSKEQARWVFYWFRYNYPQYYFLEYCCLTSENCLYPCIFENMRDGESRAEITNELFDKLDVWIQDVADNTSTTYGKVLYANNLICKAAAYNYDAIEEENRGTLESALCQSLYSTVLLENTVCTGYALAFSAMMNALDVETVLGVSETHAWNVVRLDDGNCYAVDVCWNDTDDEPPYQNDYLNVGEAIMSATNDRKESHTYWEGYAAWIPAIAKESYEPTASDMQSGGSSSGSSNAAAGLDVRVTQAGPTSVGFSWNAIEGDHVTYRLTYHASGEAPSSGYPLGLDYAVDQLTPDTEYTFQLTWSGLDGKGSTTGSGVLFSVKTLAAGAETVTLSPDNSQVPSAPTDITTTATGADTAKTEWTPVPGATEYDLCIYEDSSYGQIKPGKINTRPAEEAPYSTWVNAAPGDTYYLGVRASKTVSGVEICSGWSNFSYTHE